MKSEQVAGIVPDICTPPPCPPAPPPKITGQGDNDIVGAKPSPRPASQHAAAGSAMASVAKQAAIIREGLGSAKLVCNCRS